MGDSGVHSTIEHHPANMLREELRVGVTKFSAIREAKIVQGFLPRYGTKHIKVFRH